ncbi:hypothetical protein JD844_015909 [Phrynosoma platyrhinos]|uniref:VWFA domain-containing protein n=1 Tax=Phrynosoma platyrhinos TaxID=52577 RepID=A0ABQ7SJM0_PHRPL|nr:hypothetical protein JD844_015909 [Phrynosoma platyrhinos]
MKEIISCVLLLVGLFPVSARERHLPGTLSSQRNDALLLEQFCSNKQLDLVFIIDSSRSVRPYDFEKVKEFILTILQFLDIRPDATRVGLIQYASTVKNEFSLKTFKRKQDVERAVKRMMYLATGTMTGLAIQYAVNIAFSETEGARPLSQNVPRVIMIVTDGRPQDPVADIAAKARNSGILIFAIGVGRVDMNTLKSIGSEPYEDHVFLVANFSQIETLTSVFQTKLCAQNLCEVKKHDCEQICVNTPGSYVCQCYDGYKLLEDGKSCFLVNYCALNNQDCQHECVNTEESYYCQCRQGFILNPDKKTCRRPDYCALQNHGCQQECVNTDESYFCRCQQGFTLNPDKRTCKRINVCALEKHGCEHECVNTESSYVCRCRTGYTLNHDRKTCRRIDHCAESNHGCEQLCLNTRESYVCQCSEGFIINEDLKTCSRRDICKTVEHGCEHLCVSDGGNSYVCKCHEGFILRDDEKTCRRCTEGPVDLVFVIDGSKSLGENNFEIVKEFVLGILDSLTISPKAARIGLLQYSTQVRTEFTLKQFSTAKEMKKAVSQMKYMGKGSMTGLALKQMIEGSFTEAEGARRLSAKVPRVSVVFTDGRAQDEVSEWATKAKQRGITMYAIGIGKAIEEELREIASDPPEKHILYAENFSAMGEITEKLKKRICEEPEAATLAIKDVLACPNFAVHHKYLFEEKQMRSTTTAGKASEEKKDPCKCENFVTFQNFANAEVQKLTQQHILC